MTTMNQFTRLAFGLSILGGLIVAGSGCSSGMTREECQVLDWRGIGYEDGVSGQPQSDVAWRRQACGRHGVGMDMQAYREGWDAGVQHYCRPANGYREGRAGAAYNAVCPAELEPDFLDAYRDGRELHDLEAEVQRLSNAINSRQQRLSQIETSVLGTGMALVDPVTTPQQRVTMVDNLRRLEQERSTIKAEIPQLQEELARQQAQLTVVSAERRY